MQTFQAGTSYRHGLHFSPDGRRLMVISGWPILYDSLGADEPLTLKPPNGSFAVYAKLALGGSALVYLDGGHVHVWKYATGNEMEVAYAGQNVNDLAVSPDGLTVYAACDATRAYDRRTVVHAFDAATGDARGNFPWCAGGFNWLSVSADGRRLVGRGAYEAGVWDLTRPDDPEATGLSVRTGAVGKYVDGVAASADGTKLALVTSRGLELWDIDGWEAVQVFRSGKHKRRVSAVACSPTRPLIATGDAGGTVFLWDHTGRVLNRYDWGLVSEVYALTFSPDGLRCAAANGAGKVVVWDVDV